MLQLYSQADNPIPMIPWLDTLTFAQMAKTLDDSILLEFTLFDHAIRYHAQPRANHPLQSDPRSAYLKALNRHAHANQLPLQPLSGARRFLDLVIRRHATDPLAKLAADERGLLWKYRHWTAQQAGSLAAMLKAIDWLDPTEMTMVIRDIIPQWPRLQQGLPEVVHQLASVLEKSNLAVPQEAFECLFEHCWWPCIQTISPEQAMLYLPQLIMLYELHPVWSDWWVEKAKESPLLAGHLFWQLRVLSKVHKQVPGESAHAVKLLGHLLNALPVEMRSDLLRQEDLFTALTGEIQRIGRNVATRPQREQALRRWLHDPEQAALLLLLPSQPLLLPPLPQPVSGLRVEGVRIFKSAAMPVLLPFIRHADLGSASLILKLEDLSQDQLVLQLIRIVDGEWRRLGLDLRLTPYQAMPLGLNQGVVEFVPAAPLAAILAEHGSLTAFMRIKSKTVNDREDNSNSPPPFDALPIDPVIMDNWVRSCAGYCILTYVLGVGDRHLENLLLREDGRLVHIDFAHLFGDDPKPFAPPVKLCREMVEAMGGPGSPAYLHFKALCYTAYTLLRRHAGCLLAPLSLLRGPEAMQWVATRLALHEQHEEQALMGMEEDLEASVNALFPQVMEAIHRWAQYWRH